ncbi:MAG: S41 family peptidase [Candidatus Pacebacteria bacterium]|nr:S41 family peptidase [Candidatus Paceibacterota bacterium]MCD8508277.1 S41 family peptidase [Candidatus Paceibacterota bacterium]MCD8528228.1 S41 family peptidase [Candidatus Paceibacterota bacterium]MCD8563999.1 S41 family peptidase [Candidatus Paceibacterota bacterium]
MHESLEQKEQPQKTWGAFNKFTLLFVIFGLGIFVGNKNIIVLTPAMRANVHQNEILSQGDFGVFFETWNMLEKKFTSPDGGPSIEERIFAATEGLTRAYGDPYTMFFNPKEATLFTQEIEGIFGGVGVEIGMRENMVTIISPLKDSPAARAGLQSGDIVIGVDDQDVLGQTLDAVVNLVRGKEGTPVTLKIFRPSTEQELDITITREIISIPNLEYTYDDDADIFIISLYSFSENAHALFQQALVEFQTTGSRRLILDVRNNPGGLLSGAIDIASWFLPQGKVIARESLGSRGEFVYRSKGFNTFQDLDMVILINGGSASASEIIAGALSEYGIATLVGTQTFGKGSVQELVTLRNGSALKVTTAKWLTPQGVSFSGGGLEPDVVVEFTAQDILEGRDPQLEAAKALLTK